MKPPAPDWSAAPNWLRPLLPSSILTPPAGEPDADTCVVCGLPITPGYRYHERCLPGKDIQIKPAGRDHA